MADQNKDPQQENPNSADTPKQEAPSNENTNFAGGKFKSKEEFEKAYQSLETKLGEQGKELGEARQFQAVMQPIVELAQSDKEVFEILDKKLRKIEDAPKKDKVQASEELKEVASNLLLDRFEEKHSINKLSQEDQKALRTEIGTIVTELTGQPYSQIDLRRLPMVLDRAYTLAKANKKSEARESDDDVIPSIPSSPGKSEKGLNAEQASVAEKLGLTREQYLDGMKSKTKK